MSKERLDVLLVNRGLVSSREKAKALIMAGNVFVDGQREDKAGTQCDEAVPIEVRDYALKYVSRGGYKLEKAIRTWTIRLTDVVCMDVGASTGGFTDCMLQNGAARVYAVDVGTNQLAWKLRQDERVVVMEKTNARYINGDNVGERVGFVSVDVAFISLTKVLWPVSQVMGEGSGIVCLIKPQFEAGREKVGKKGVVKDEKVHREVMKRILEYVLGMGFHVIGITYSPIKGPKGNIEYLLYMEKGEKGEAVSKETLQDYVEQANAAVIQAHEEFANKP